MTLYNKISTKIPPQRSQEDVQSSISKALELLGSGYTQAETAKKLGVNVRSVQRWISQAES